MSFTDDDHDDLDEPEAPAQQQRRQPTEAEIRIWRKKARQYDDAEPELTKLQRENLLLRTPGLADLSETKMRALFATHSGDMTPEAIRATAQDLGFVAPPEPAVPPAEEAALGRIADASAGADSTNHDPLSPVLTASTEAEFWAQAEAAGVVSQ